MKLFVYAAFVASFLLGFIWNGSSVHAKSGDPKPETKKSECPYLNSQASGVCPYMNGKASGQCPYTGKSTSDRPVKKIEVKKV